MVTFIKDNGSMIWLMDMVFILIFLAQNIKDIGMTINRMVKELKHGQMNQNIKDNILKEKGTEKEFLNSQMDLFIKENLKIIKFKDLENDFLKTKKIIKDIGKIIL